MPILMRASVGSSGGEGGQNRQELGRRTREMQSAPCGGGCEGGTGAAIATGRQRRSSSSASTAAATGAICRSRAHSRTADGGSERCSSHSSRNSPRTAQCTVRSSRRNLNRLSSTTSGPASAASSSALLQPLLHASLLALLSLLALGIPTGVTAAATTIPFGYQTSSSSSLLTGSTYAASAAYDPVTSTLYVVGAAYEASYQSDEADGLVGGGTGSSTTGSTSPVPARPSDCYLTALALPNNPAGASGIMVKSLGETGIAEACTDVTLLGSTFAGSSFDPDEHTTAVGGGDGNDNVEENNDANAMAERTIESSHLLVLGHTAPRGLLTDLRSTDNGFDRSTTTYGFGLDLTLTATLPGSSTANDGDNGGDTDTDADAPTTTTNNRGSIEFDANLLGGRLFQEEVVTYPVAGTVPPRSLGEDEEFEGDDVRLGDVLAGGPEFAYLLLQTSDVDPNAGGDNNFGFGVPQDIDGEEEEEDEMQQSGGRSSHNKNNNSGGDGAEDEEEQDPTVPSSGGSSLVVKKVALTSTTGALADGGDDPQTNTMVGSTMIDQWTQQFSSLDGTSVTAADLIYVPRTVVTKTNTDGTKITKSDFLLVAGSTRGFGPSFGQSAPDGTYDTDGFVTLLDPATGQLVDPDKLTVTGRGKTSLRIRSTFDGHDVVHGLCLDTTQTEHVNTVYVVGSTTGTLIRPSSKATTDPVDGSLQIERPTRDSVLGTSAPRRRAFVVKLNLDEGLVAEWIREYHGEDDGDGTDAYATGCAVSAVDGAVYVGGVVTDGGRINGDGTERHRHVSAGGDDIFLVRVDGTTGRPEWTRQIGSRGDDRLASRGGVLVDGNGGAILVGTTGGSLMRSREYDDDTVSRDAFVMSITGQGETVTPVVPGAMAYFSNEDRNCYFVNDPILYLVIVSIVSALCSFVLGHALRQRQGLTGIIARYSSNAREVKGTVVKKNEPRRCDVDTRHLLVQYVAPSSSGGRLIKRLDNVSKAVHQNLSVGSLVNLHILPGHDKSGIVLQELRLASRRLGRDAALVSILFLASFGMSILFASCLPWYGWVIATVPLFVTASMAWLLWRNAGPNMELVFVHGQGCILSGRGEAPGVAAADDCEWTDNDQTDDDNSSPTRNNDVV